MNDVQNFEDEFQAMLAEKERAVQPTHDFAARLLTVPTRTRTLRRVDVRRLPRWTPPLIAAAAVAVVALIASSISWSPSAHHRPAISHSSTPPPTSRSLPNFFAPSVQFRDAEHGYAIGNERCTSRLHYCPTLLRTDNGGTTWTRMSLPSGLRPVDDQGVSGAASCTTQGLLYGPCVDQVLFADPQRGYVWSYNWFYVTSDGGRTWHGGRANHVSSLVLVGNYAVRLHVLAECSSGCPSRVERAKVGSTAWTNVTPIAHNMISAYVVGAGRNVYAEFLDHPTNTAPWVLYRSTDAGTSWRKIATGCFYLELSPGLDGSVAGTCTEGEGAGTVRVLAPGASHFGATLQTPRLQGTATGGVDILVRSATDLLAFVYPKTLAQNPPSTAYESTDGGSTWSLVGAGISPWTPIDQNSGYRLGNGQYFPLSPNAYTSLQLTTDGGHTFQTLPFVIQ